MWHLSFIIFLKTKHIFEKKNIRTPHKSISVFSLVSTSAIRDSESALLTVSSQLCLKKGYQTSAADQNADAGVLAKTKKIIPQ